MKKLCKETDILSLREQAALMDEILKERLQTLMPCLLRETGFDMWLVLCREYNEDPVFSTLTPYLVQNASRLCCLIFSLSADGTYEALNLSRPDSRLSPYYTHCYDPKTQTQYEAIVKAVRDRGAKRVAVNVSPACAMGDGLSHQLWENLHKELGDVLVCDDTMAVRWLETRTDRELALYPAIYKVAMDIQKEAYSAAVITPGVTTTTDVEWYIMQRINDMGLSFWFSPDVDLQRKGADGARMSGVVIEKGDLLHTDMGITYMGLNTDSQRLAYVPRDGETEIPAGILAGMARANRFQDIVRENFVEGRTGNEIFAASVQQGKEEGIRPMLYTHPIGFYGHGAGPTIGLYDNQGFVPGNGERKLCDRTCYALELNVLESVPEWDGQDVWYYVEETIAYADGKTEFLDPHRDEIILVK